MIRKLIFAVLVLSVSCEDDPCAPDCDNLLPGNYPNPQDCTKYYTCTSTGPALPRNCPPGTEFDPGSENCEWPDTAGCTADPDFVCGTETPTAPTSIATTPRPSTTVPTSEPPSTTTTTPTTAAPSSTTTPTTAAPSPTTTPTTAAPSSTTSLPTTTTSFIASSTSSRPSTGVPLDCFPDCPSTTAIYANPRDCKTYFMCFGNNPFLMTCNPGDEYNPETETCEEAGSFECQAGPDQPCVAVTASPARSKS